MILALTKKVLLLSLVLSLAGIPSFVSNVSILIGTTAVTAVTTHPCHTLKKDTSPASSGCSTPDNTCQKNICHLCSNCAQSQPAEFLILALFEQPLDDQSYRLSTPFLSLPYRPPLFAFS